MISLTATRARVVAVMKFPVNRQEQGIFSFF
jgi:hypothetical protein